jgi:hypothetical protein
MNPWAEMDSIIKRIPEPTGFGWFTKSELMAHYKMSEGTATRTIRKMLNDKLLDEWNGTLSIGRCGKKWKLKSENKRNLKN